MVEFALVSPLFFLLLFGGLEFGLMFRGNLAIEDVGRNAARIASIERADPEADRQILTAVANREAQLGGEVTKVIIFSAPTLDAEVPDACIDDAGLPRSVSGVCNAYGSNYADVASGGGTLITGLTDAQRSEGQNLGVYVEYEHEFVTGFFDTISLSSTTVEVVELDL